MIRNDEQDHNNRILMGFKGKPKRFYGHMRRLQSVKANVTSLKMDSGELTVTNQEAAEVLRLSFQKMFTKDAGSVHKLQIPEEIAQQFSDESLRFDEETVAKKILQLSADKSEGPET